MCNVAGRAAIFNDQLYTPAGSPETSFEAFTSDNLWHNTELVKAEEIRSYDDLLQFKWKGKIGYSIRATRAPATPPGRFYG